MSECATFRTSARHVTLPSWQHSGDAVPLPTPRRGSFRRWSCSSGVARCGPYRLASAPECSGSVALRRMPLSMPPRALSRHLLAAGAVLGLAPSLQLLCGSGSRLKMAGSASGSG